jgi:hypothetical protein
MKTWAPLWPARTAAWYVGLSCAAVLALAVNNQIIHGEPFDAGAKLLLLATGLRLLTVLMAVASWRAWGRRVPGWLLLGGLWGAAATQLAYPVAELVVKLLILVGAMDPIHKGISNMTAEGWFNFAGVWLLWGVPGALFALAALSYQRRSGASLRWALVGCAAGVAFLFLLGLVIG